MVEASPRASILIVDDDPHTRLMLSVALQPEPYRLDPVGSGTEAIERVRCSAYSAALLDVRLPDLDGLAVLTRLHESDPKLPVVLLSGQTTVETLMGALSKGAFAYVSKPYDLEELKGTLRRAVDARALAAKAEQMEAALRDSEERFRSIVESTPDAIILADHRGMIISLNKGAQRLFGYLDEDILGKPLTVLMPARYREAHQKGIERSRTDACPRLIGKTVELHGLRKDGSEFPLELSLATWQTASGTFYSGIIRDITERKQAEEALRESELRFRQVTENIREAFWMTDVAKTQMLYISPAYETIWGRSCNSLYASPSSWLDAIHPGDRKRVQEAALTTQVTGEYNEEYRIIRPDGSIRWIQDRAFPVRDESGKVYRIAGIAACITERKQAQAALRHALDRIESILTCLPGAILIVDKDERVAYANPVAHQQFGSGNDKLVGRLVSDIFPFPPSQWSRLFNEFMTARAEGSPSRPDGEFDAQKRTYQYRLFPIHMGEHERQVGLVVWDITEQKHLRDQLIQTEKLASLGTLVSGMAHEINNPVQGILGMAEIIQEESDPMKIKEYAQDIAAYSQHVATVVRDFACYARPSARDEEVAIDLGERMTEAVKMVRRCPQFGYVAVATEFQSLPRIQARRTEIDQVFVNLISNAVQAMNGTGALTLKTARLDNMVTASVTDSGCGIPKAIMSKIFDPFFTTKDPGKGTGLGLSVVYKIVSKYGGTIDVDSTEGEGTTFTVRLPLEPVRDDQQSEADHGTEPTERSGQKERVGAGRGRRTAGQETDLPESAQGRL